MLKQLCENRSREAVYNEVNNYPEGAVREAEKHKDIFREEPVKRKRRAERNKRERDESCEIHTEPDDAAKPLIIPMDPEIEPDTRMPEEMKTAA